MTLAHPKPVKAIRKRKRISRQTPIKKRSSKRGGVVKADQEWAKKVKARAESKCEFQNCPMSGIDAHHVFGKRAFPRLRYDLDNGIALCRDDHDGWHRAPVSRKAWFAAHFPATWAQLTEKAKREARLNG